MQTFRDPADIARHIIERTGSEIRLALPLGLGKANTIVNSLTDAAIADPSIKLEIFTALTLERPVPNSELERRFLTPAMDRLFGNYPALKYAELLHQGSLPDNIDVNEFFLLAGRWRGVERVQQNYISANYTHAYDYLAARKPNVVAQLLARHDGRYSLSSNTDISADLIADRAAGKMDFLLAGEVNSQLPFMEGASAEISEAEVGCLLDNAESDFELFSSVKQPVGDVEMAIGLHVSRLIEDGGTIQIGIGSIGDAIAQALLMRHSRTDVWQKCQQENPFDATDVAGLGPFDAGLYAATEMLVDGLMQLFLGGVLKREVEGATAHAGFFVESRSFYQTLREMPADQRAKIQMRPVSFTNQLYGDERAKRAARVKARFVNNAMLATLLGAVTSDGTGDGQVISGVGGQFNFVSQAFALKDARSIITVKAARQSGGKTVSNIVWNYPHTTIPRHLKDIIVTEYGIADLRGKSDADTIAALLAVTDSRFQNDLLTRAKKEGKLPSGFAISEAHRLNTPQRLREWLKQYRDGGDLPQFPFGTDFTETEQILLPALGRLKKAQVSKAQLAGLAWTGFGGGAADKERSCLERMGLDAPTGIKEHVYAALLRGALRRSATP